MRKNRSHSIGSILTGCIRHWLGYEFAKGLYSLFYSVWGEICPILNVNLEQWQENAGDKLQTPDAERKTLRATS